MKYKILVFPCGSEIGLEIHNAIKWSTHIELFGASSIPNHGKYVYKNYIGTLPYVDDQNFIPKIIDIIKKYKINCIFPAHDSVVLKLAKEIKNIPCKIIGSPLNTCQICRSKKRTYETLKSIITVPKMFEKIKSIPRYPVFLKPDIGQGSKETYIAHTQEEVNFYKKKGPSLLILEYLPGAEYTIDCFTDKNRMLRFVGARERKRITNGISVNTISVNDPALTKIAQKINKTLILQGAWFFQVKKNKYHKFSLLEVAPRVAGSMALYRNTGINFTLLSVFDALNLDIKILSNNYNIEMDRALFNRFSLGLEYKHVYIDLDDTIIFNNLINPFVIMFLYQCVNKKIKIHLLSRHQARFKTNIEKILIKHRLLGIFDTINNVDDDEDKAKYIKEKNAIFIDDSFKERQSVSDKLKIATFEISSIESLIDWKY